MKLADSIFVQRNLHSHFKLIISDSINDLNLKHAFAAHGRALSQRGYLVIRLFASDVKSNNPPKH